MRRHTEKIKMEQKRQDKNEKEKKRGGRVLGGLKRHGGELREATGRDRQEL